MKKIISIFQTISIIIGFAVIALFIIPAIIGIKPFIVLSGSMENTIKTGSIAYVNTHVNVQDIQVGDIIAFNVGNEQVTHRAIAINENNTFTTKGDANENEDLAPIKFEDYKGKTIFSIPYVGKLITTCQTKTGHFIVFLVIGLNILCLIFSGSDENKHNNMKINKQDNKGPSVNAHKYNEGENNNIAKHIQENNMQNRKEQINFKAKEEATNEEK